MIGTALLDRRYRSAALSCILCAADWRCNFDPTSHSRRGEFFSEFNIYTEWLMTIIKKRGRIVRNIFVIDRYDAPLRVPTGCWEEMLSRMYSVDPNAYRRTVCWISSDHFQIQKSRRQSGKLSCEMLQSTLLSSFKSDFKRIFYKLQYS